MTEQVSGPGGLTRSAVEALVRRTVYGYLPEGQKAGGSPSVAAPALVVNISARHIHLSQEALETLFGPGAELTVQKELYQSGAFAAEQTLTVFGPRKQMIANVRILGPLRDACQVELSFTDLRFLGIDAPVRVSGDIQSSPGCYLVGPAGGLELEQGVIRAARHVHMCPADAAHYQVSNGDLMRLEVEGEQPGLLEGILCRVGDDLKLEVHVDTDEGNALDLVHARRVELVKAPG
jgi:putative phosphotransacetylase